MLISEESRKQLEPVARDDRMVDNKDRVQLSIAISLKRIADVVVRRWSL